MNLITVFWGFHVNNVICWLYNVFLNILQCSVHCNAKENLNDESPVTSDIVIFFSSLLFLHVAKNFLFLFI